MFLDPHDCLVAADAYGIIYFIPIGSSKVKNKVVLTKSYRTISLTNKEEQFPITAMGFCPNTNILFLGDEFGNIKFWNITQLLKKID